MQQDISFFKLISSLIFLKCVQGRKFIFRIAQINILAKLSTIYKYNMLIHHNFSFHLLKIIQNIKIFQKYMLMKSFKKFNNG